MSAETAKNYILAVIAIACLMGSEAVAQRVRLPSIARITVGAPPFKEEPPKFNRYAAEEVVGFLGGPLAEKVGNAILVSGINDADRMICVDIEQSNGGYSASFAVPNPRKGQTLQFVVPSRVLGRLNLRAGQIAIRARAGAGAKCASDSALLSASWSARVTGITVLMVNSQRASRTSVQLAGSGVSTCQPLTRVLGDSGLSTTSFDTVCTVDLRAKCGSDRIAYLQFRDGASYRKPLEVRLRAPCLS
jgi:hypothetical protein